ncbi:MAG: hypothetical protein JXB32_04045 [Deltaproteobacteria bacterium]|nr:hypothetical protein [Deltaproteobacteria bacterium]
MLPRRYAFRPTIACLALAAVAACATGGPGNGVLPDGAGDGAETPPDAPLDDGTDSGCLPGLTLCPSGCVDTNSDPGNCGACGNTCGSSEVCNEGRCSGTCGSGRLDCPDGCVDPQTDDRNCGTCGNACADGLNADGRCELGHCILVCHAGWQDRDSAPGCETACAGSGTPEVCNGIDDDCDGATDEDFACAVGRATPCTTSCGTTGSGACTLACEPPAVEACTPPAETCNGIDDDCDTLPDDGFACSPGTSGSCSTPCGSTGTRACTAGCIWDDCVAPPETCNGRDDDCDTVADDGFECAAGATSTCPTSCGSTGTRTCGASCAWQACVPPPEACNGRDDDCDTLVDETSECVPGSTQACPTSCGTTGQRTCNASCTWDACVAPPETCNGRDDDCDTVVDDGFECLAGTSGGCTTSCGTSGTRVCAASCAWGSCTPPAETCNRADDDCDGAVDNGFRAVTQTTTYATLSTFLSACNGTTQSYGPECNAAIHRFCCSAGCANAGFGPVESAYGAATVACVIGEATQNPGFPALQAIHSGCDGVVQRAGPDCSCAIKRWCTGRGFASGFGPVENSYPDAYVVCVPSSIAVIVGTTYTELSTYQSNCNGTTERWGLYCNSAIHQFCRARGHVTGFGPVENVGDAAYVTCMDA